METRALHTQCNQESTRFQQHAPNQCTQGHWSRCSNQSTHSSSSLSTATVKAVSFSRSAWKHECNTAHIHKVMCTAPHLGTSGRTQTSIAPPAISAPACSHFSACPDRKLADALQHEVSHAGASLCMPSAEIVCTILCPLRHLQSRQDLPESLTGLSS